MLTLKDALICSPHDAILTHVLKVSRAFLHAHPEYILSDAECAQFKSLSKAHAEGKPLAYLLGHKEFWSLNVCVNEDVLIPRPETENLVEGVLNVFAHKEKLTIADLGTGSGAIALALAKEKPHADIYATDICPKALAVAKMNAKHLQLKNIYFRHGHWLDALPDIPFDAIVSNPPYVEKNDPFLDKNVSNYEPHLALFAENNGLDAIHEIIFKAAAFLKTGGYLFLEHGFQQAERIRNIFAEVGYTDMKSKKDLAQLDRMMFAKFSAS